MNLFQPHKKGDHSGESDSHSLDASVGAIERTKRKLRFPTAGDVTADFS